MRISDPFSKCFFVRSFYRFADLFPAKQVFNRCFIAAQFHVAQTIGLTGRSARLAKSKAVVEYFISGIWHTGTSYVIKTDRTTRTDIDRVEYYCYGIAATGQYGDLVEMGVIDPVKVLRLALENAVSSASTLLLTEATLVEVPEPKAKAGAPGVPNGDDY